MFPLSLGCILDVLRMAWSSLSRLACTGKDQPLLIDSGCTFWGYCNVLFADAIKFMTCSHHVGNCPRLCQPCPFIPLRHTPGSVAMPVQTG